MIQGWRLENSYKQLPEQLYSAAKPESVPSPKIVVLNEPLALELGLDIHQLQSEEGAEILTGSRLPPGASPIAQAYAGHQFGHFTMLGDGRAILLGEQITPSGERRDIQLKGSGRTPYSRRGDGRAALAPMLREHLISEAMHALGISTTRALAVCTTGLITLREEPLPGAVLCRVAASHIRVGTFQFCAALGDKVTLRKLVDYSLQRHFPNHYNKVVSNDSAALSLLDCVISKQAELIAKWMHVGFVHGVMNTDNMAISGETIDYGPCAFIDVHNTNTVFSSIDRQGRYCYGNQPRIAHWNIARFAETLLPLIHSDMETAAATAKNHLSKFPELFEKNWIAQMRKKLGLFNDEPTDKALFDSLLSWMEIRGADHTNTFRALDLESLLSGSHLAEDPAFCDWHSQWQMRLRRQPQNIESARTIMRKNNPDIIPRNHKVEEALVAAVCGDMAPYEKIHSALLDPFSDNPDHIPYRDPPPKGASPYKTFCGT